MYGFGGGFSKLAWLAYLGATSQRGSLYGPIRYPP